MQVTIVIDCDNASFWEGGSWNGDELARIVANVADQVVIEADPMDLHDQLLFDINGNRVGSIRVVGDNGDAEMRSEG